MISAMLLCLIMFLVGIGITHILVQYNEHYLKNTPEKEYDEYKNNDSNHIYYERSLIEKMEFHRRYPDIPVEELRTFTRLIKEMRS